MHKTTRLRLAAALAALSLAPTLSGCGGKKGCEADTDCKGDRVCVDRECIAPPGSKTAVATKEPRLAPATATATVAPTPAPIPAPAAGELAADGLPVEIPPPGSPPPSVAEWNAVPREISVAGSTRLKCETKMLREWLKVNCRKNHKGEPIEARHVKQSGQQAFQFVGNGLASIVVQVVRGKEYQAQYIWDLGGSHTGAELTVSWPQGNPRPTISLTEN